ncbi:MAG TPA: ethanolamine utilization protein EutH [Elusimicrobiota bacterium]|nr:ethanolamine utilization protein EutH [Elusimicrobiota bacterium]
MRRASRPPEASTRARAVAASALIAALVFQPAGGFAAVVARAASVGAAPRAAFAAAPAVPALGIGALEAGALATVVDNSPLGAPLSSLGVSAAVLEVGAGPALADGAPAAAVAAAPQAVPASPEAFATPSEAPRAADPRVLSEGRALSSALASRPALAEPVLALFFDGSREAGGESPVLRADDDPGGTRESSLTGAAPGGAASGELLPVPAPAPEKPRLARAAIQAAFGAPLAAAFLAGCAGIWPAFAAAVVFQAAAWGADRALLGGALGFREAFRDFASLSRDLVKAMAGVLFLAPLAGVALGPALGRLSALAGLDPAVAASLLAIDMGGYPLAKALALSPLSASFYGLVVGSMLGATLVFTVPVAFGLLKEGDKPDFARGVAAGIMAIPLGAWAGGLVLGATALQAAALAAPIAVLALALFAAMRLAPERTAGAIVRFGDWVQKASWVGLALGLASPILALIFGAGLATAPVLETFGIIAAAMLVLVAVVPLMELLRAPLGRLFRAGGRALGVSEEATAGLFTTLVAILPVLAASERMDARGKILNAAFMVCAAWTFADHLAFVLAVEPAGAVAVLAAKLIAGIASIPIALWLARRG